LGSWERSRVSEIDRPFIRTLPSQPLRGVFCCPKPRLIRKISRRKPERETRILRARAGRRVPEARGLSEGTRRKPDTDGRANPEGFAIAARFRAPHRFCIWFAACCGSTDAGGEDFGYFALETAGSNPACDVTHRGGAREGSRAPRLLSFRKARTGVDSLTPISPVPQRVSRLPMPEASARRWWRRPFPANSLYTIRGEDRCYFVCETRGRGFESRPAYHAPVAQRIERYPAGRKLPAGVSAIACSRIVYLRTLSKPVVKSAVTSQLARSKVRFLPDASP
jgi:hypothetical protein